MFKHKALTLLGIALANNKVIDRLGYDPWGELTVLPRTPMQIKQSADKAQGKAKWKSDRERAKFNRKRK